MKLSSVANFFDKQVFTDAYTGAVGFKGQLDLYGDVQREGLPAVRRIISTKPGTSTPARKVVSLGGVPWMLSASPAYDYFLDAPIRLKHIAHRSDGLAEIKTIAQELSNTAGTFAYGAAMWLKGLKESDESSFTDANFQLYFSSAETLAEHTLVKLLGSWYTVRYSFLTQTGFVAGVADRLDEPNFATVSYAKRVYSPVTDTFSSTPVSIKALRIRWQNYFEYLSSASDKFEPGDDVVLVRVADIATPTTGDLITLSDGVRRVDAIQAEGLLWLLKVRRA